MTNRGATHTFDKGEDNDWVERWKRKSGPETERLSIG
jgi:hypothetical protein